MTGLRKGRFEKNIGDVSMSPGDGWAASLPDLFEISFTGYQASGFMTNRYPQFQFSLFYIAA